MEIKKKYCVELSERVKKSRTRISAVYNVYYIQPNSVVYTRDVGKRNSFSRTYANRVVILLLLCRDHAIFRTKCKQCCTTNSRLYSYSAFWTRRPPEVGTYTQYTIRPSDDPQTSGIIKI